MGTQKIAETVGPRGTVETEGPKRTVEPRCKAVRPDGQLKRWLRFRGKERSWLVGRKNDL